MQGGIDSVLLKHMAYTKELPETIQVNGTLSFAFSGLWLRPAGLSAKKMQLSKNGYGFYSLECNFRKVVHWSPAI